MSKFEILQVRRDTDPIENAQGDNRTQGIFTVIYKVRINKKLTMSKELTLWAEDELDAYQQARHKIEWELRQTKKAQNIGKESNNVIQDRE